jgi:protein tyrosine phosphatase
LPKFLDQPGGIADEFDSMPQNRVNIVTMPKLTEGLNRYMNILPNNHTRVVLTQVGDDETSTYINANWIDGFDEAAAFIACQVSCLFTHSFNLMSLHALF